MYCHKSPDNNDSTKNNKDPDVMMTAESLMAYFTNSQQDISK